MILKARRLRKDARDIIEKLERYQPEQILIPYAQHHFENETILAMKTDYTVDFSGGAEDIIVKYLDQESHTRKLNLLTGCSSCREKVINL